MMAAPSTPAICRRCHADYADAVEGLFQIEPDVFGDARGKFVEIFRESRL